MNTIANSIDIIYRQVHSRKNYRHKVKEKYKSGKRDGENFNLNRMMHYVRETKTEANNTSSMCD
jgi:hypothetical protein